jgi:selenium-dependent xanthine dehydrogenase
MSDLLVFSLTINGEPHEVAAAPKTTLLTVLREQLRLTGTKDGCATGHCGSCMVIKDGEAVRACLVPLERAAGATITTIEGLAARYQGTGNREQGTGHGEQGTGDREQGTGDREQGTGNREQGTGDREHPSSLIPHPSSLIPHPSSLIPHPSSLIPHPSSLIPHPSLHPLQQAFIDQGAVQCGFCTPGFLIAGVALLERNPTPSLDEIYAAYRWNVCRCTGYNAIIRATQSVAGQALPPPPAVRAPMQAISRNVPRPDALGKVDGSGIYAADLFVEGMLHARVLRSAHPHARLLSIDTSQASALPGVVAVLTAADIPGRRDCGIHVIDWPVLCYDTVRYVGDALALVVAESEAIAAAALPLIKVAYEPLPVVSGPKEAAAPGAPLVHAGREGGNLLAHYKLDHGDLASGFAQADVVIEREYRTQTVEHAFIEPEAGLAVPSPDGRITVYCGGQIPFGDRRQIAASLALAEDQVRVVNCLIGGAFGGKEDVTVQILSALGAQATGRPVKLVFSRRESLLVHPKRHATIIKMKTGARRDGSLTAHEVEIYGDGGAYASLSGHVMLRATTHAAGPYVVPNARVDTYAMYTNNVPSGAFRGFGVTQSGFAMESQIDQLAEALGMTPLEFRRRNLLRYGQATLAGQVLEESCGLSECLEAVAQALEAEPPIVAVEGDKRRAWGLACAYKNTGYGSGAHDAAGAIVELDAQGGARVRAGAAETGQGLPTILAQIVSEELGVPYAQVSVLLSDTDLTPDGDATTASRQTYMTGNAARAASSELRARLSRIAAELLDAAPGDLVFAGGEVRAGAACLPLSELVRAALHEGIEPQAEHTYVAPKLPQYHHVAFGFAAQAVLVEVDIKTGETKVLKVLAASDVGRALNPLGLLGQVEGSISMGLGMALQERFVMEQGQVKTDTLHKCRLPMIAQTPDVATIFVEHEASQGPYGGKGVGELNSIPTAPAIINAIYNATGVRCYSLPADKAWLKTALAAAREEPGAPSGEPA